MVRMGQKASSPLLVKKDCLITDFILNCWFKVNEDFFFRFNVFNFPADEHPPTVLAKASCYALPSSSPLFCFLTDNHGGGMGMLKVSLDAFPK